MKETIFIVVEEGLIREIFATQNEMNVIIREYDTEGADEKDLFADMKGSYYERYTQPDSFIPSDLMETLKRRYANQLKDEGSTEETDGRIQENEQERLDTIARQFEDDIQQIINHHRTQAKCAMGGESGWTFRSPGFHKRMRNILNEKIRSLYQY